MSNVQTHLEMIQNIINRLSRNSFLLKGWSVVLVSSFFALAAVNDKVYFVFLAYFPLVIFWILDAYFLWQERLFRELYNAVRLGQKDKAEDNYSMNTSDYLTKVSSWFGTTFHIKKKKPNTLLYFYGTEMFCILIAKILLN